jgi:uncharacterized membrane protein
MNALLNVGVRAVPVLAAGSALAQDGNMMNGGMWGFGWMGGYGGYWMPILLVAAVVTLVVWVVKQSGK